MAFLPISGNPGSQMGSQCHTGSGIAKTGLLSYFPPMLRLWGFICIFALASSGLTADPRLQNLIEICQNKFEHKEARRIERILRLPRASEKRLRALRFAYLKASEKVRWVLQNILLEEYAQFATENSSLASTRPENWIEEQLQVLIWKWLFLSDFVPSNEQIVWIYSDTEAKQLFETGIRVQGALVRFSEFIFSAGRFWDMDGGTFTLRGDIPTWKRFLFFFRDLTNPFARILIPAPFTRWPSPTSKIFNSLWKNPDRRLSPEEEAHLRRYGVFEYFQRRQAFLRNHPIWKKVRHGIFYLAQGARYVTAIAALNLGVQQARQGMLTAQDYQSDPQYRIQEDEIRLLTDLVPFPHVAIQIGGKVYSYGQTHVSSQSLYEYLHSRELRERFGTPPEDDEENKNLNLADSLKVNELVEWTGLSKLPRSIQVVSLKVTAEERDQLMRHFEMQVGKRYENTTFVNDCATMLVRGLEDHSSISFCGLSRLIDASPSQLTMYWGGMKIFNPSRVTDIYQVRLDDRRTDRSHLIRNAWINMAESNLFIEFFLFNQAHRLFVDLRYSDAELQNDDPELVEVLKQIEEDVIERWREEAQIKLFETKVERVQEDGESYPGQVESLVQTIAQYFDEQIAEAKAVRESSESNRTEIVAAGAEYSWLEEKKEDLLKKLGALSSP